MAGFSIRQLTVLSEAEEWFIPVLIEVLSLSVVYHGINSSLKLEWFIPVLMIWA